MSAEMKRPLATRGEWHWHAVVGWIRSRTTHRAWITHGTAINRLLILVLDGPGGSMSLTDEDDLQMCRPTRLTRTTYRYVCIDCLVLRADQSQGCLNRVRVC